MVDGAKLKNPDSDAILNVDFLKWPLQEKITYLCNKVEVVNKIKHTVTT